MLFVWGEMWIPAATILVILGIFAGMSNNLGHFVIMQPLSHAKEFANGLFITSINIGIALGTAICGLFISLEGSRFATIAAALLIALSIGLLLARQRLLQNKAWHKANARA